MRIKTISLCLTTICLVVACNIKNGETMKEVPLHEDVSAVVDSVYRAMTWDERIPQLYSIRPEELMKDGKISVEKCRQVIPHGIGHIAQYAVMYGMEPDSLRHMVIEIQNYLKNCGSVYVPAIFHEEMITGFASKGCTMFPQQLCASCSWDTELLKQKTVETAKTARSLGATMALSPVLDVDRTPTFNRIEESFGEDAYLTSAEGLAFVEGLQLGNLRTGVAACTKHFLGYGGASELNDKEIYEEILMPHEVAIEKGGSQVVMIKYHDFKGVPAASSPYLMDTLLRSYLSYKGLVVSDYSAILSKGKSAKWSEERIRQTGARSLVAGMDVEFSSGYAFKNLKDAIDAGEVSEDKVERAVKRVLTLKARLGLLDRSKHFIKNANHNCDNKISRNIAYKLASESVVLLKNDGILPLNSKTKVALVGPNANSFWAMCGDYTFQSMYEFHRGGPVEAHNPEIPTLLESLKHTDLKVSYSRGCDWSVLSDFGIKNNVLEDPNVTTKKRFRIISSIKSKEKTDWKEAVNMARGQDVIIAAVGENVSLSGEGRFRKGLRLPGKQEQFVKDLIDTGKPVILVIFGGRPQVIHNIKDKCAAIMLALYPGEEGGPALADLLTGKLSPSGKLSVTYPTVETKEMRCYNQGDKLKKTDVEYPFGYGLTYSKFKFSDLEMKNNYRTTDKNFQLSFSLKNIGDYDAVQTTQLYLIPVSKTVKKNLKPIQLKGFKRIALNIGDKKKVTYTCPMEILSFFNGKDWQISPGDYKIAIGSSSRDLELETSLKVRGNEFHFDRREDFFSAVDIK